MSRLGKNPITVPAGVEVTINDGNVIVKGTKGTLKRSVRDDVTITVDAGVVTITPGTTALAPALWGTYSAHIKNMIKGVTEGYTKVLELEGVGYRAEVKGNDLVVSVGFSHPVALPIPSGITVATEKTIITLASLDKDALGQYAADIRMVRPPEPYKGKGIRYRGEFIIRKQGKKAS